MSNNVEQQIKEAIERMRGFIQQDGGDIRYVKFEEGIVYVEMLGACQGCAALDTTLKDGVESILVEEIPGVIAVEQI
ncbi:NifU family protein [Haloplasma contractile]|uniref:NifU protein n=1 Tax=Haloplasma contractile SSD-17B TaxID=1033810 RepID=F7PTM4_9MOLU|nr:NifU family protein [Haloplasma contractile]ERJ12189.1 NifU protein [Haloplasma contractile SSD-17B]